MCERDQQRCLAPGAGASPADPESRGTPPDDGAPDDVVQAVAEFVDDLVDEPGGSPQP